MKHNHITLGQAIDQFIQQFKLQDGIDETKVRELWGVLMGKPIAKHTTRIDLRENKLYLTVDSAPLKNELFYSRDKIKEVLNRELGKVVIKDVFIY